ncbi:hypothetical protein QF031_000043 [Pseudarthrobacter defluvii]|uniref:hypothetical protein n=1 Tax=Pseudarthrobacter defluvii TaxID=410837 RepID=UPI00278B9ADD|nr:hypothetical protein [Pseudarthrobacter defluvii]MDQ0767294.1 hypothetical protein [Pseudarthrobacter defluvii]
MMTPDPDRLYRLLPGIIRVRDAEQGHALRDLLRVLGEQADLLEADIRSMYANLFIETCQDWVVPYLGDLVGYRRLPVPGEDGASGAEDLRLLIPRRAVADTLRLRRRKGTRSVLDDVAASVAGWPAAISDEIGPGGGGAHELKVDLWRLPSWPLTRVRPFLLPQRTNCFTLSVLGNDAPLYERTDSQESGDPPDIEPLIPRPIDTAFLRDRAEALYGPDQSLCLFENGVPIPAERIKAQDLSGWRPEVFGEDIAVDPVRGRVMFPERRQIGRITASYHYGFATALGGGEYRRPQAPPPVSAFLFGPGHLNEAGRVLSGILATGDGAFTVYLRSLLTPGALAELPKDEQPAQQLKQDATLDAELNRILQAENLSEGPVEADRLDEETLRLINAAPLGSGRIRLNRLILEAHYPDAIRRAFAIVHVVAKGRQPVIMEAVRSLQDSPRPPICMVVVLADSGLYVEPVTVDVPAHHTFSLRAADGCRPTIVLPGRRADIDDMIIACGENSRVEMNGIMVASHPVRITGHPSEILLRHCTLVPGWELDSACWPRNGEEPSLILTDLPVLEEDTKLASAQEHPASAGTCVELDHTITGTIIVQRDEVDAEPLSLLLRCSTVDATDTQLRAITAPNERRAHALLTVDASTVIGSTWTHAVELAQNSTFLGEIKVARRQIGCIRYCYVPPDSRTPRRHACQPDLVIDAAAPPDKDTEADRVKPVFMDPELRYGRPNYCRLADDCADELRQGADDGSEMGVFHSLFESQRRMNLEAALEDYLPLGWTIDVTYQT